MKSMAAYLLVILAMVTLGPLVQLFIGSFFCAFIRLRCEELVAMTDGIAELVAAFFIVFVSTLIFSWLGVRYSLAPVVVMLALVSIVNISELIRFRHTVRHLIAVFGAIGSTLGIILGGMCFVYDVSSNIILSIAAVPFCLLFFCFLTSWKKSFPFWKLCQLLPDEAYQWFLNDSCWEVYDPPGGRNVRPDKKVYNGGFPLFVPSLGRRITVYGKFDSITASQNRFVEKYADSTNLFFCP